MKLTPNLRALYLGCEVQVTTEVATFTATMVGLYQDHWQSGAMSKPETTVQCTIDEAAHFYHYKVENVKPILRRLEDMTEEEARELVAILFKDEKHPDDRVTADEISIDLHPNDNATMVDGDMAVVIEVSCRCFEGQLGVTLNGTLILYDEVGRIERLDNTVEAFAYSLSKYFDFFGLIDSGEAIDAKTLKA